MDAGRAASWEWLPAGTPDLKAAVDVYDLPLATTSADTVTAVHAAGAHAVCWIPVGLASQASPHAKKLEPALLGKAVPSNPDEHYLDIR